MRTSAGPASVLARATPASACRGATKKYQLTQPIRPSPATITIQSVADIESSTGRRLRTPWENSIYPLPLYQEVPRESNDGTRISHVDQAEKGRICSLWAARHPQPQMIGWPGGAISLPHGADPAVSGASGKIRALPFAEPRQSRGSDP